MTGYRLSPDADSDLDGIWNYTAEHWGVAQADQYTLAIRARLEALLTGAAISRPADEAGPGYLKCAVGTHMIYFTRGDRWLDVVRILHQRMDPTAHL